MGQPQLDFRHGNSSWRYESQDCPERAVAYEEQYLAELIPQTGLIVEATYRGNWSGLRNGLSFQDLLVLRKPA